MEKGKGKDDRNKNFKIVRKFYLWEGFDWKIGEAGIRICLSRGVEEGYSGVCDYYGCGFVPSSEIYTGYDTVIIKFKIKETKGKWSRYCMLDKICRGRRCLRLDFYA